MRMRKIGVDHNTHNIWVKNKPVALWQSFEQLSPPSAYHATTAT